MRLAKGLIVPNKSQFVHGLAIGFMLPVLSAAPLAATEPQQSEYRKQGSPQLSEGQLIAYMQMVEILRSAARIRLKRLSDHSADDERIAKQYEAICNEFYQRLYHVKLQMQFFPLTSQDIFTQNGIDTRTCDGS